MRQGTEEGKAKRRRRTTPRGPQLRGEAGNPRQSTTGGRPRMTSSSEIEKRERKAKREGQGEKKTLRSEREGKWSEGKPGGWKKKREKSPQPGGRVEKKKGGSSIARGVLSRTKGDILVKRPTQPGQNFPDRAKGKKSNEKMFRKDVRHPKG